MKTLHLAIIIAVIVCLGFGLEPVQADANDISIQDILVQPTTIRVGDTFAINATLVNDSPNTITVKNGCGGPFSIVFDNHAMVEVNRVCNWMAPQIILDPGENITGTSLVSNLAYKALSSGAANATVTFSYIAGNKTDLSFDNNSTDISKSFLFAISDSSLQTTSVIPSPLEQFKSGILPNDVTCNSGLQLIIKAEDDSPACVKPDAAQKLVERGWASSLLVSTTNTLSKNICGQFYTAPNNPHDARTTPVLLMDSNSTACVKLTFTIVSNYKDCNGQTCQNMIALGSTLHIGDLHYEKHDNMFSVSAGKDYTHSFIITTIPDEVDLANYPIGANFTVTYIIKPLTNATGFYDQSIPKLACESYPLAVGYATDQVNASDFGYIDSLNPPCAAWIYTLTGVEISGLSYKDVTLP